MPIDDGLISHLEELSCLVLADGEKCRLAGDLEKILGYMARLSEVDTEGVPEQSHPFANVNAFREDVVTPSLDNSLILRNAPNARDGMFVAPQSVE